MSNDYCNNYRVMDIIAYYYIFHMIATKTQDLKLIKKN